MQQTTHNVVKTSCEDPRERSLGGWFRTSLGRQVGTSNWDVPRTSGGRLWNVQIGCLGDVGQGLLWDVLGTNIFRMSFVTRMFHVCRSANEKLESL